MINRATKTIPRPRIVTLAACLMIGAVVNFSLAAALQWPQPPGVSATGSVSSARQPGLTCRVMYAESFGRNVFLFGAPRPTSSSAPGRELLTPPPWAMQAEREAPDRIVIASAAGAPLRSFFGWTTLRQGPSFTSSGMTNGFSAGQSRLAQILYRPIWPGLIVNTIFYGALVGTLHLLLFHLRPTLRRHRGHCPKCAYDLRRDFQFGCPECGWRRPRAAPVTQPQRAGASPPRS